MSEAFDLNAPMDAPIRAREAREKAEHEAAMEAMRSPEFEAKIREIAAGIGKVPPKRVKGLHVGAPACFALELACQHLSQAFGEYCYLVGSALERADWRDIDVRMILDDEDFKKLFPAAHVDPGAWEFDPRWLVMTCSISAWLSKETGLPVDFQFQPRTHANERHSKPRNALGMRMAPRSQADGDGNAKG